MADSNYPLVPNHGQADVPVLKYHDNGDGSASATVYVQNSSGGGGGSSLSDVLLTDSNSILFVGRDSGGTTGTIFTYYRLDTQAAYTPVGTIKAAGNNVVTLVDGADVTQGTNSDAAVAAGAAGTVNSHLRAISRDIGTVATSPAIATAVVKAASTAAAATDPALVVSVSPNTTVNVTGSVSTTPVSDVFVAATNITAQNANPTTGTATANSTISVALNGQNVVTSYISVNSLGASVTAQITYDGSNWFSYAAYTNSAAPLAEVLSSTIATTTTGQFQWQVSGAKGFRLSANTATVSGTLTATLNASVAASPIMTNVSLATYGAAAAATLSQVGGTGNAALVVATANGTSLADVSAVAWAAASGNTSAITDATGGVISAAINVSVFTTGSSTGLDIFLQHSPDGGTTWFDRWQCEAVTAATSTPLYIPPIYMPAGRRRWRWVNRTGAATTATVTITINKLSIAPASTAFQWFDRTAGVLNGTTATATAWYDVSGCRQVCAWIPVGTASGAASYQLQFSSDQVNILPGGTSAQAAASTTTAYPNTVGTSARYVRLAVTTAATSQTAATAPIVITGC